MFSDLKLGLPKQRITKTQQQSSYKKPKKLHVSYWISIKYKKCKKLNLTLFITH